MDVTVSSELIDAIVTGYDQLRDQNRILFGELNSLTTRFTNMKNERDRLKAKLDLLNIPDRPYSICRNQVYGKCIKQTCEWEELR